MHAKAYSLLAAPTPCMVHERCFDSEMRVAGVGSHRGREGTKSVNA